MMCRLRHRQWRDLGAPAERRQLEHHRRHRDLGAAGDQQVACGGDGAAGGQDVVDDDDPATGEVDAVGRDLQRRRAVLQGVGLAVHRRGQLAALADGQHADAQPVGHRTAEQETPGVDTGHQVGALGDLGQRRGDHGETVGVGQHGREVLELDTGLGEVGDLAGQRRDDVGDAIRQARYVTARTPIGPCSSPRPTWSDCLPRHTSSSPRSPCAADGTAAASACRPTGSASCRRADGPVPWDRW